MPTELAINMTFQAGQNRPTDILCASGSVNFLEAAATDGKPSGPAKFSMLAYTGAPMRFWMYRDPVIIEFSGITKTNKARPVLRDHNPGQIVGHTTAIKISAAGVEIEGLFSAGSTHTDEVVSASRNGFPWQSSVGIRATRVEEVKAGAEAKANGKTVTGPVMIVRASELNEISFVALGADDNTSATLVAAKESAMTFSAYLASLGLVLASLTASELDKHSQDYAALQAGNAPKPSAAPGANANAIDSMNFQAAENIARIGAIGALAAQYPSDKSNEIHAKAITDKWTPEKAELEFMRAARPAMGVPAGHSGNGGNRGTINAQAIEASLLMRNGLSENRLVKSFTPQTLEAAEKLGAFGLKDLIMMCSHSEGKFSRSYVGDVNELLQAGLTTTSLPNILGNTLNKLLLQGYQSMSSVAMQICSVTGVSDFKQVTRHILLGTGGFQAVNKDGELKSGALGEQTFTNKADTAGQMITLDRRDVINDDLGSFLQLPSLMGLMAAAYVEHIAFTALLGNAGTFFGSGNGNVITGAGSALGFDGLNSAFVNLAKRRAGPTRLAKAKDSAQPDSMLINMKPKFLLVPPELELAAQQWMGSEKITIEGSTAKNVATNDNPYRNKAQVLSAAHLSDTNYTGNSTTAWYLLADPNFAAAIELVFLNNNRKPVIERAETPANVLGLVFRGYIDVGVNLANPNAALRAAGA